MSVQAGPIESAFVQRFQHLASEYRCGAGANLGKEFPQCISLHA
jgi:hypothetical protein